MIDLSAFQMWLTDRLLDHQERDAITYLMEENRILRARLHGRRLRFTDDERRRLAGGRFD